MSLTEEKDVSRKDFQMIADVVKNISDANIRQATAMDFAHRLKNVNPRFDIVRFVKACQPTVNPELKWCSTLRSERDS